MSKAAIDKAAPTTEVDEELIDTLIAISVVAKRLAENLRKKEGDKEDEQNERTLTDD